MHLAYARLRKDEVPRRDRQSIDPEYALDPNLRNVILGYMPCQILHATCEASSRLVKSYGFLLEGARPRCRVRRREMDGAQ